jgi:hypothetical protein
MIMEESGEFKMKYLKIADEIFSEACNNINAEERPALFILIKDLGNGEADVDVMPVDDPAKRKEAGDFASILAYKNKKDLILFISDTEYTLNMVYTESDGKSVMKIGVKDKTLDGKIYIENIQWAFNVPFEQYVSSWNEENSLFIEQMIKESPVPEPMGPEEIVGMAEDLLRSMMDNNCSCEKCRRERGEILESGASVHGDFNNILDKLEIPKDSDKIN